MEEDLKKLIRENKVIPFVGAGVSMSVLNKGTEKNTFLNWSDLLSELANDLESCGCEDAAQHVRLSTKLKKNNYLQIADDIKSYYPSLDKYNNKLDQIFDKDIEEIENSSLDLARSIWNLGQKLVITTNYDKVLHWASDNSNNTKMWDIQSVSEQAKSLGNEISKQTVWHLHGHIDNKHNMILTTESYDKLYDDSLDSQFKTAFHTLKTKLATKHFLFIGYSLDDEYFVNEIEKISNIFENLGTAHYVLLHKDKKLPEKFNQKIVPIYYEDYGEELIKKIKSLHPNNENVESKPKEVNLKIQSPKIEKYNPRLLTELPPKNENFIGRVDDLQKITDRLKNDSTTYIVNGIGGVGKSDLAVKYLLDNQDRYNKVAFMEFTKETKSIEAMFYTKFKEKLQLDKDDDFSTIIRRLQELPAKNLLLIDNLENIEDFEKIKSLNNNFDLLITTRRTDIDAKYQLPLNTLNDKDAKELFLSIYDKDENIEDILEYLDNHPLFINLTTRSLAKEYITLKELRDNIKNETISKIDSTNDKTFKEHLQDTFNRQFIKEDNEELKKLLQILSIFPSIEIDFEVFEKSINQEKLKVNLQKLVERGWLSKKENSYKLHQIIKTFIQTEYKIPYQEINFIFEDIGNYIDPDDSLLIASHLQHYIPIIEYLITTHQDIEDNSICKLYDSLTYLYYSLGKYNIALDNQEKSFQIRKKLFGENSEFTTKSLSLLSTIYQDMGELKRALEYGEKALTLREEILGEKHPSLATSYGNVSILYQGMGDLKTALEYQEKSLRLRKEIFGEKHPDVATSYNNISTVYQGMGDLKTALEYQEKALKLREELLGEKHPALSTNYNNISIIYQSIGDLKTALEYQEKALKLREELLGEKHPDLATNYSNIATVYNDMGELKTALEYQEKALILDKEILGEKHPNLGTSYNNISMIYKAMGELKTALEYQEKSVVLREEILGEKHPDLAISYNNISLIYQNMKECYKAKKFIQKAILIWEEKDYYKQEIFDASQILKQIEFNIKKEGKTKPNKRGRFCKDI